MQEDQEQAEAPAVSQEGEEGRFRAHRSERDRGADPPSGSKHNSRATAGRAARSGAPNRHRPHRRRRECPSRPDRQVDGGSTSTWRCSTPGSPRTPISLSPAGSRASVAALPMTTATARMSPAHWRPGQHHRRSRGGAGGAAVGGQGAQCPGEGLMVVGHLRAGLGLRQPRHDRCRHHESGWGRRR